LQHQDDLYQAPAPQVCNNTFQHAHLQRLGRLTVSTLDLLLSVAGSIPGHDTARLFMRQVGKLQCEAKKLHSFIFAISLSNQAIF